MGGVQMRYFAAVAAVLLLPGSAAAADLVVPPPPAETLPTPTFLGLPIDVAFGAAITTDYVSRGLTNSLGDPAFQPYFEPSVGPFYINVWGSNVDYGGGFEGAEIDTAIGLRHEWGQFSGDIGWVHYFYAPNDVSPDYGEIYGKAGFKANDMFELSGNVFFAPNYNQTQDTATWIYGQAKVNLPYDFSVYGGVGYQFFEDPDAFEQLAWTAGASYSWKALTFDLRYWDTDLEEDECEFRTGARHGCDERIVGTVSVDTSWTALREVFAK
jgi:uncharacterized protein (TIGR02001 family)